MLAIISVLLCLLVPRYGFASMERQRQRLPVYNYRTAILYLVETHATTIVVGETGSGKTTQIPQVRVFLIWVDSLCVLFASLEVRHPKLEEAECVRMRWRCSFI